MLFNLIAIIFLLICFWGVGGLFRPRFTSNRVLNPFQDVFLGIFLLSFFGLIVSFFYPLKMLMIDVFLLVLTTAGLYSQIKSWRVVKLSNENIQFFAIWFFLLVSAFCLFMGYENYPYNTDTDYYHANAVTWLSEYGIIKGLANINLRIGFNTSWHVLAALINKYYFLDRTSWIMPLVGYCSAIGYFLWEIAFTKRLWVKVYSFIIIQWTFLNILTWGFPSLHYDFVPLIYNAILLLIVLKIEITEEKIFFDDLIIIFIFSAASFILKPMGLVSVFYNALCWEKIDKS